MKEATVLQTISAYATLLLDFSVSVISLEKRAGLT